MMPRSPSKNIIITHAYRGTNYYGWQKTKEGPSIEEELKKALETILQEEVTLNVASRTDRGVHAFAQIAGFMTTRDSVQIDKLLKSINALIPKDIRVNTMTEQPLSFHPTMDAIAKEYHYLLCTHPVQLPFDKNFSWHFPHKINLRVFEEAKNAFIGTHDFKALANRRAPPHQHTTCTITSIKVEELDRGRYCIKLRGNRFLYKMARNIVGTLLYAGIEKIPSYDLPTILNQKKRSFAGVTAPAHGLHLWKVFYSPEFAV